MIRLTFIGDIFPADELFTYGFGIKSKTNNENVQCWKENISQIVGHADYIVGNLESPLVDDKDAKDKTFYGVPLFADMLKDSGINILNLANNHIAEHGADGFAKTVETLYGKGIKTIGGLKEGESEILTIKKEQTTICMASFCDERVCSITNPGCYASLEEGKVFYTLECMKALNPDVIIFIFHWGNEYIHFPSLEQRTLAYKLIDNGANLIIGHHPHVIQPYESYHGGHIIYSLGNFCFDDVQSERFGKGMIANVDIQKGVIHDISFAGVSIQDMAYSDCLVKPMDCHDFEHYFTQINGKYNQFKMLSDWEYNRIYQRTLAHEHTKERVYMRLNIAKKIISLRHKHKKQLLNNIKKYIFK